MSDRNSPDVKRTLRRSCVHERWIASYRNRENVGFFKRMIDYITGVLKAPRDGKWLDAGCGTCLKSILLAQRGYSLLAVDFSEAVLQMARSEIDSRGLEEKITLRREDILELSFCDEKFDYILCWGVLMHIPDLEGAMEELSRVLKPGGTLIIGENNMFSLQSVIHRLVRRLRGRPVAVSKRIPAGRETWVDTEEGKLLVRQMDMRWFKDQWRGRGFSIQRHVAGQFTELYYKVSSPFLRKLTHLFNHIWFKYIKCPSPALGNILMVQKRK